MTKTIRIGCASGFWGDSFLAAPQLIEKGDLDYLVFDYLAEITMSILARQRDKDPSQGYAHDFVSVTLKGHLKDIAAKGIKVVSNAGGINPKACAEAIEALVAEQGLSLKVAYVEGDDLLPRLEDLRGEGMREMFRGDPFPEDIKSINAYLGAPGIAAALKAGADIVVTGRCVDSAVTLGPCVSEFGWGWDEYDKLSGGSLAGHILECGAQATGGLFTDWEKVPGWENIGYSICEISEDGSFVATKPENTGGLVSVGTTAEQMLYEIADPQAYFLADVICDFSGVTMKQIGPDRVQVKGAKGYAPSPTYKVSATFQDGFRVGQYLTIGGIDAAAKARRTAEAVLTRMDGVLRARNLGPFFETSVEVVGAEDSYGAQATRRPPREVVLKLAAKHENPVALNMLIRELTSSATSMSPGTTGMGGNRPKVSPVVRLYSFLYDKTKVPVRAYVGGKEVAVEVPEGRDFHITDVRRPEDPDTRAAAGDAAEVSLIKLAFARSGDKGNNSNIGIIARDADYLPYIAAQLTERKVLEYFRHLFPNGRGKVERFFLPGTKAFNFVLHDALGGGGIASLRNDPQGKALGQMLLDFKITVPRELIPSG